MSSIGRKIITVSHFERNRIREALNIPADRITTIYNGYSRHFLIKRGTALLAGFQIDDVVECQHKRNRTVERGCVGRAMQQVRP